ncbi:kinesin-like protein KIF15-A isoform X2 [Polypterus senegalus]|uniref:kinesin-like protein KIF15-A isoform X2 n=1 Tax=Polypterus senegalus TaxID=55291 RepID=UPI0019638129|nr:kinesin-like protein KIF15-A isoform X2 [Polypterus senegalus]
MGVKTKDLLDSSHVGTDGDAIKVFVRVRPPTQGSGLSTDGDLSLCLTVSSSNTIRLHSKPEPKVFTYDHVADTAVSQEEVFSCVAKNIIESCMNGYNGTVFAYGQTGSGKTFTMLGPPDSDNFTHNMRGIIPRSFEYLFFLINREIEKTGSSKSFLCKCSFIEIYNEQIFDLLDSASASLFLRENIKKGVFVDGAVEKVVTSAAEAYQVLSMGWRNRRVASTSMNRESSRSHAVFTVTIESKETVNEIINIRSSQLNLVDLAGSERQKDTHSEGTRLKEAGSINRSLSCLGQVMMALVDVSNGKSRHICYRDSKLTFLLRDSLGGNAKTFIIANVHPGSKCFGETLSTLHFAQRAKLIKNKAVVNEDTEGNVRQLQAELKKLKEQLSLITGQRMQGAGQLQQDISPLSSDVASTENNASAALFRSRFLKAVSLWKKSENDKKNLLQKVAQLEDAWAKKDKFIQSTRMIVKFREDHVSRLEKTLKNGGSGLSRDDQNALIGQLRQEIELLKEQVDQHPRVAKYATENHALREENKRLRLLDSVKQALEIDAQTAADLEGDFLKALETEEGSAVHLSPMTSENTSSVSIERLKAQLTQKQTELTSTVQAYEEFKELTKKKILEMESNIRYLDKANQSLEKILEATKAHKRQEVSQLNKMHVETIKNLTTPTKAYNLRSRLVPHLSPEGTPVLLKSTDSVEEQVDEIFNEPPPPEMSELAYEAVAEELRMVQDQASNLQIKLDEEEVEKRKLLQEKSKLEEHSTHVQELFSTERALWSKEQQRLGSQIKSLEKDLVEGQSKNEVLKSEVHDLRVVLQSADKELNAVKVEYSSYKEKQELEWRQISSNMIEMRLQLDNVRLEYEKLLEEKRFLQDAHDNLQEVMKFESEEYKQSLSECKKENATLQSELAKMVDFLKSEKDLNQKLTSQLEDKETTSKELLKTLDENINLKKQISEFSIKCDKQASDIQNLEICLTTSKAEIAELKMTNAADKGVISDMMNQIQELRSDLNEKNEILSLLSSELEDIKAKYCAALTLKEENSAIIEKHEKELLDLKEAIERKAISDTIEKELLQDDLTHATEEIGKLTETLGRQEAVLQAALKEAAANQSTVANLEQQLKQKTEELAETMEQSLLQPAIPTSLPQTPKTPVSLNADLSRVLETQDAELHSLRSSVATLEMLVNELNEERSAKNDEILRLKCQLCELENMKLEKQNLLNQSYSSQKQRSDIQKGSSEEKTNKDEQNTKICKELAEEKAAKKAALKQLNLVESELKETRATLTNAQICIQEMTSELRLRSLEVKSFQENFTDQDKLMKEVDILRKQVELLTEENGKLAGHHNLQQKIQYMVRLKKDNTKLVEENELLRLKLLNMEETFKRTESSI